MAQKEVVQLPDFRMAVVAFEIVGTAPLMVHRFDAKAQQEIQEAKAKKAKASLKDYDDDEQLERALHRMASGQPGFPSGGIKGALTRGAKNTNLVMTDFRTNVVVLADCPATNLVGIEGEMMMDKQPVRVNNRGVVRVRPKFPKWSMTIKVKFNEGMFSTEQIALAIRAAGMGGLGEYRPEKCATGTYGTFDLREYVD